MAEGPDATATDTITIRAHFRRLLLPWILVLLVVACALWFLEDAHIPGTTGSDGLPDIQFSVIAATVAFLAVLLAVIRARTDDPIIVLGPDSVQINDRLGSRDIPYHAIAFIKSIPVCGVGIRLRDFDDLLDCVDASPENTDKIVRKSVNNLNTTQCEFVIRARKFTLMESNTPLGRAAFLSLLRSKCGLHREPLMPEAKFVVEVEDNEIVNRRPDGKVERVALAALRSVTIETNDTGPLGTDVWWFLEGDSPENRCVFPGGATGEEQTLEFLQKLPGFDNEKLIEAMACTDNARFVCWQVSPENDDGLSSTATTPSDSTTTP